MQSCPLCGCIDNTSLGWDGLKRDWVYCLNCYLAYVDSRFHLDWNQQKERYDLHENAPSNGYIQYLNQCIEPSLPILQSLPPTVGLDYGSGPGSENGLSVLAREVQEKTNHKMMCYDPIYQPSAIQWDGSHRFSFVFSTEVWEHFTHPNHSIHEMNNLLEPLGYIFLMTTPWKESVDFRKWHYARDETHVVLYHHKTMEWICRHWEWSWVSHPKENVWIFQKSRKN